MRASSLIVAILLVGLQSTAAASSGCSKLINTDSALAAAFDAVYACPGVPKWQLLPGVWSPIHFNVTCTTSSYTIYTGTSLEELAAKNSSILWCGLRHFSNPKSCAFSLSPFSNTYVGIKVSQPTGAGVYKPEESCTVNVRQHLDAWLLGLTLGGSALFLNAPWLAMSTGFRLSAGSLGFAFGAVLVLTFVLMRSLPHRNKLMAALAVSASSTVAVLRWLFGTWAPSLAAVVQSKPFHIYLASTALLGLGVTYWFDDPNNVKLTTTIRVVLQLTGLVMTYMGSTQDEASIALVGLLLSSKMIAAVGRALYCFTARHVWQRRRVTSQPRQAATSAPAAAPQQAGAARKPAAVQRAPHRATYDSPAALLSDEEGWEEPEQHEPAQHEPAPRPRRDEGAGSSRSAGARQRAADAAARAWTWGSPVVQPSPAVPTPLHLRTPPPNPWQEHEAAQHVDHQAQPAAGHGVADESDEDEQHGGTPWSVERVAVDITRPRPQQQQQQAQRAASPAESGGGGGDVSPLVAAGKIFNMESNRVIMLNKPKYNELVGRGYTPDFKHGVLLPPQGAARAGASTPSAQRGTSGSGAAGAASGSGGATRRGRPARSGSAR